MFGFSMHASIILANPNTPREDWKITHYDNDVALLYAINKDNWSAQGFGIDCQDAYVKGITAFGGDSIVFKNMYSKNSASCAFQFMGNRVEGHKDITNSQMIDCIGEGSRWNFVFDGRCFNSVIANNVSINAVNRHISIDPQEADGEKESRGIVVNGNALIGRRDFPTTWLDDPSPAKGADFAIGTKSRSYVLVTDNYIQNWNDDVANDYDYSVDDPSKVIRKVAALGIKGSGGAWMNNIVHTDVDMRPTDCGIKIQDASSMTRISGNVVFGSERSIEVDNSTNIEISNNTIDSTSEIRYPNIDDRLISFPNGRGSGTTVTLNRARGSKLISAKRSHYIDDSILLLRSGTSEQRPIEPTAIGEQFFDTSLGKPIWWYGDGWIDASGDVV